MNFTKRMVLAGEYDVWRKKNSVKDCPFSVISYLQIKGLLRDDSIMLPEYLILDDIPF